MLALCMLLALLPGAAMAAGGQPVSSSNKNREDYATYGKTVTSYLYENQSGGLTRVEYINNQVVIEDYDSGFRYLSGRTITPELPLWGGFFAGNNYNFLIYGQENKAESDSAEVIRVVKYDKSWNRIGQASLNGANTVVPFDAGSLRCDEYGGYLYIRTCHEMYTSSDGLNHQSNLTMAVRQSDMTITDSYYEVMNSSYGYVSHSFNQFITVDEAGKIVALDHGDAYPRGVVFSKYYADAGTGKFTDSEYGAWCSSGLMMEFAGAIGDNTTGASVGGLAETTDCYIMAYNYNQTGGSGERYPYYHWMDKATGTSWSAQLSETPGCTTPVLAPTGLSGGYMLWNGKSGGTAGDTLYYLQYGANGKPGETKTAAGPLSDCQPVYYNGRVVWYVTDNSAPVFYGLDASGVTVLNGAGAAAPAEPETPATPEVPATPATPAGPAGIMSDANPTFTTSEAVMPDGTLRAWKSAINIEGKAYDTDYTIKDIDTGVRAVSDELLLKTDGTLYLRTDYGSKTEKMADNVKQFAEGVYLKNDGTVWGSVPLEQPDGTRPASRAYDNYAYITDNAKQVASFNDCYFVLKNDGSLWSWCDSTTMNFDLGRDGGKQPGALRKVMDDVAYIAACMAIKNDGSLWSWGMYCGFDDEFEKNEDGTFVQSRPRKLMDNVVGAWTFRVRSQDMDRFVLTRDGTLYSWGDNTYGTLGYVGGKGTAADKLALPGFYYYTQETPRKVDIDQVTSVYSGGGSIFQKRDGSLWSTKRIVDVPGSSDNAIVWHVEFEKKLDGTKLSGVASAAAPSTSGTPSSPGASGTSGSPSTPSTPNTTGFSDVSSSDWFYPAVQYVRQEGLMSGIGGGRFNPNSNLSRAQLAQILYNASGKPAAGTSGFHDVPAGSWYASAISWAAQKKIVSGYGGGKFGPNDNITREQLAVMLWRYAGQPSPKKTTLNFTDAGQVKSYAVPAMCWAVENGIVSGYGRGRLGPSGLATRAQAASMLMRYMERP